MRIPRDPKDEVQESKEFRRGQVLLEIAWTHLTESHNRFLQDASDDREEGAWAETNMTRDWFDRYVRLLQSGIAEGIDQSNGKQSGSGSESE